MIIANHLIKTHCSINNFLLLQLKPLSMNQIISLGLGYLASLLLALSLLVNNDIRFRWLNSFGCLAFILYGIMISAMPIIITNSLLLIINSYSLVKIYLRHEKFDLLEFNPDDALIKKFLDFYSKDIQAYFPEYHSEANHPELRFVVLRDLAIANIFVVSISPEGNAEVKINYTVEKYRDFEVGKFIFDTEKKYLANKGVKRICYRKIFNKDHERFLKIMGFNKDDGQWAYSKNI